ncbi:MAG TPA: hypothetical protein VEY95_04315 [Azospirillaceae bacterium]|nr:hypothetical protein [Azospirillaceae bacterium]
MSITSIPSNFYSTATQTVRELMWERLNKEQKSTYTDPPPSSFLSNPGITAIAREQAWLRLSEDQKKTYRGSSSGSSSPNGLILSSGGQTSGSYRSGSWSSNAPGSTGSTTAALDFTGRLESRSADASEDTRRAYRSLWSFGSTPDPQAKLDQVLAKTSGPSTVPESGNGGALFVNIRAGTGSERAANPYTDIAGRTDDNYDVYERQVTAQAKEITDRFGQGQGLIGYDLNNDGSINGEQELFGFDSAGKTGPSLNDIYVASAGRSLGSLLQSAGNRVELDELGDVGNRLMVLRSDGTSVRLNQSSVATTSVGASGYTEYTAAQTALQLSSTGKLEVTVYTQRGFDVNLPDAGGTGLDFSGQMAAASQTPMSQTTTDFRNLFPDDNALGAVLKMTSDATDTNGGAVFLNVRPAMGSEINTTGATNPTQAQNDAMTVAGNLAGLFSRPQVMLAYDRNGDGTMFNGDGTLQYDELFGFDAASGAGMNVQDLLDDLAAESDGVLNLSAASTGKIPDYNRLFALTYNGTSFTSVRLNQATGPTGSENVVGQTGLRLTNGKLELVAYAGTSITV